MHRRVPYDSGMTLVEILGVIVVMSILSGLLVRAVAFWQNLGRSSQQLMVRQQELQTLLDRVVDGTSSIAGVVSATKLTVAGVPDPCGVGDTSQMSVLQYTQPNGTQVTYRFVPAERTLYMQIGGGSVKIAAQNLGCFAVRKSDNVVDLRLQTYVNATGGPGSIDLNTTVKVRNL